MKSAKPVITTTDSGGPNEFVQDGKNGFSVSPSFEKIAEKINYLNENVDAARRMGEHARATVDFITWDHVAGMLLEDNVALGQAHNPKAQCKPKPKMVVAVTFPVYPPRGGGQARVFNLYSNLAKYYDIEIVSLCSPELPPVSRTIAPGLTENRVPLSNDFVAYDQKLSEKVDWIPVTDISAIEGYDLVDDFKVALRSAIKDADIVVASHPFLINAIREMKSDASIWLEAHNVEFDLKRRLLPHHEAAEDMLRMVYKAEEYSWAHSDVVYACTVEDLVRLEELYGPSSSKKFVVPNGVDFGSSMSIDEDKKNLLKSELGIGHKSTALFMGSWHGPNLEAAEQFIQLAPDFPDSYFFIIGSAGLALTDRKLAPNVIVFGELDEEEKRVVMCASDVAVNPMLSGSGSNLKMLDFFAYGIPVISTSFGARGIEAEPAIHFIKSDIRSLKLELSSFMALKERYGSIRVGARELVRNKYSWGGIAERFRNEILNVLS